MPSISDIIKNKTTRDQARTEQRQMERENLSAMRDGSLSLITSSPEHYRQYLDLQADNIHCSVGNVALTMAQLQGATRIGTTTYWHGLGRYVRDDAISAGATVFVPPRNKQYRGRYSNRCGEEQQSGLAGDSEKEHGRQAPPGCGVQSDYRRRGVRAGRQRAHQLQWPVLH